MALNNNITLTKGAYSVELFTSGSSENLKNVLKVLPPVTAPRNQDEGVGDSIVVDLLRITRTFQIDCQITATDSKTAKQVKEDLKKIFNGADVESVPVVLVYEDESISVFPEDCVIKKVNNDNVVASEYTGQDSVEYTVAITLVAGKTIGT